MDLKNKVIVITGGAGGIGTTIADAFLLKGVKTIILLDINEKALKVVRNKLNSKHSANKVITMQCDVCSDLVNVSKKIFEDYKVDVLVNCAGILADKNLKKIIDINVSALIECSIIFYAHMRKDKGGNGGTILNLASHGGYSINPYFPVYRASKFAVIGFTRSLGHIINYNKTGVCVVAICPGFTDTDLLVASKHKLDEDTQAIFDDLIKNIPCQPTEVVGKATVEVYEKAHSGSAWEIKDSKPVVEVLHVIQYAS